MSTFSVWFWHIFALVFALLISLPTAALVRIAKKLAVHQSLVGERVSRIHTGAWSLETNQQAKLIEEFNQAIYLLKRPFVPPYTGPCLTIELQEPQERLELYLYGSEIDVVRVRHERMAAYQIRSQALRSRLEAIFLLPSLGP